MTKNDITIKKVLTNTWTVEVKESPILTREYELYKSPADNDVFLFCINNYQIAIIEVLDGVVTIRLDINNEVVYTKNLGNGAADHFVSEQQFYDTIKDAVLHIDFAQWWDRVLELDF